MNVFKSIIMFCITLFLGFCIVNTLELEGVASIVAYFICGLAGGCIAEALEL